MIAVGKWIPAPVHPHVCGERGIQPLCHNQVIGSSPRVWGTRRCAGLSGAYPRFIPTCVGNASLLFNIVLNPTVHPHVCGERCHIQRPDIDLLGSSPRVWGTHIKPRCSQIADRFIPTCVGNAMGKFSEKAPETVHPHVCGERAPCIHNNARYGGSSPRVWGTPGVFRGNISALLVHPHVCGERPRSLSLSMILVGSSPRVWGTHWQQARKCRVHRFIPTCVGNAMPSVCELLLLPVHPHVCGERSRNIWQNDRTDGSSPRVWGTQCQAVLWLFVLSVHPHVCGERPA